MKIATEDFAALAGAAAGVAAEKHANPIARFARLEALDGRLSIMATDFEYWLTRSAPCEGDLEPVLVSAKALADMAKALKGDTLDVTTDATHMNVKAKGSRRKLATQPASSFPTLPALERDGVEVDSAPLRAAIEYCGPFTDAGRPPYNGVHFGVDGVGDCVAYGTDGKTVARYAHRLEAHGFTLSPAYRKALLDNLPDCAVTLASDERRICVSWAEGSISGPLVEGQFPDVERVIPRDGTTALAVQSEDLHRAVTGVRALADGRNAVALSVASDAATLSARDAGGEAVDDLDATMTGAPLEIGFNATYLERICRGFGKSPLTIAMDGPAKGIKITSETDDRKLAVVMPMRI